MSWVKTRAKLLWHSGHFYQATLMHMFGRVKPWTPFRFLGKKNVTVAEVLFEHTDEAWAILASHITAWSLTWAAAFMQNPVSAKLKALELASYCHLPDDYAGHPANVSFHHIPNKVTHTWLVSCIHTAIPDMQALGADINKGYDMENVLHEIGMLGNGVPFKENTFWKGESVTMALLAAGADPTIPDHTGHNMLHLATMWGAKTVITDLHAFNGGQYWQSLGSAKDAFGRTPFDIACEAKWMVNGLGKDVMQLLGGDCPANSFIKSDTREEYCLGSEEGEDTAKCKLPLAEQSAGFEDKDRCDLEVWDASKEDFSMYTFIKHYMSVQRPVVVRNAFTPTAKAKLNYVREFLGDATFTQVSVPYAEKYGRKTRRETKVGDFLSTCMNPDTTKRPNRTCSKDGNGYYQDYIFEVPKRDSKANDAIRDIFVENLVEFVDFSYDAKRTGEGSYLGCPQFFSGPNNSGAQMHTHIMAHNMLYEGQKFWWFLTPLLSFTSNIHAIIWRDHLVQEQEGILTCTQHAGDIMFVPTHWGHGIVNQADSMGFACEFEWTPWYTDNVLPYALTLAPDSERHGQQKVEMPAFTNSPPLRTPDHGPAATVA
eukprot:g12304.t1